MEEFRGAFEIVLAVTTKFGIPLVMLFLLGCGIRRTDWLLRVVSRLLGEKRGTGEDFRSRHKRLITGSSNLAERR